MVSSAAQGVCLVFAALSLGASGADAFTILGGGGAFPHQIRPALSSSYPAAPRRGVVVFPQGLTMGFLGWNFGEEMGGKGIREILGIISCEASHILVKGPGSAERCAELKEEVQDRVSIPMGVGIEEAFSEVARECSQCPSAKDGGSLGVFKPGQMVPEFDRAAFSAPILAITGPVETKFGHHLILVKRRTGDPEVKSGGCG